MDSGTTGGARPEVRRMHRTFSGISIEQIPYHRSGAKDRRAIDPPPVVTLRLLQVHQSENGEVTEVEVDDYG
jgi:hypothetical protein